MLDFSENCETIEGAINSKNFTWNLKKVGGDAIEDTNRDIIYRLWLYYTPGIV